MNHLIVYAHPNAGSFNHAILETVIKASEGHNIIVRDLNLLGFNPMLGWQEVLDTFTNKYAEDAAVEHSHWKQADVITLIYPLWWMGFPAILKGYLDRVFSYGVAYKNGEKESIGLFTGKKVQQFVTLGNSNEKYDQKGFFKSFDDVLGKGLFEFCGITDVRMHYFGSVGLKSTDYAAILQEVELSCSDILKN